MSQNQNGKWYRGTDKITNRPLEFFASSSDFYKPDPVFAIYIDFDPRKGQEVTEIIFAEINIDENYTGG